MNNIKKLSILSKPIVVFTAASMPLWQAILWSFTYSMPEWIVSSEELNFIKNVDPNNVKRLYAWLCGIPCEIIWLYIFYVFYRVLNRYSNNNIFSLENAQDYTKISKAIIAFVVTLWIGNIGINLVWPLHNTLLANVMEEFSFLYLIGVIFGLCTLLISLIMREAHNIAEEQKNII